MTPQEVIAILESLKDHINDDGKRELSMVQKEIESWDITGTTPAPPIPFKDPSPFEPKEEVPPPPQEEPAAPEPEPKPKKPWKPLNTKAKKKKK